jgi:arginyl-tRNA synthetase
MLLKWESGDESVLSLWKTMNQWVYDGFLPHIKIGCRCILILKVIRICSGANRFWIKAFSKRPDGSVWIDLTDEGLDRKIVLRSDGTAVYMTQDIGTAIQRVRIIGCGRNGVYGWE